MLSGSYAQITLGILCAIIVLTWPEESAVRRLLLSVCCTVLTLTLPAECSLAGRARPSVAGRRAGQRRSRLCAGRSCQLPRPVHAGGGAKRVDRSVPSCRPAELQVIVFLCRPGAHTRSRPPLPREAHLTRPVCREQRGPRNAAGARRCFRGGGAWWRGIERGLGRRSSRGLHASRKRRPR